MHKTTSRFWKCFYDLPPEIQEIALKNFELLKKNPLHSSLHFKKAGKFWSIRVGRRYRALSIKEGDVFIWVWIGSHDDYERLLK